MRYLENLRLQDINGYIIIYLEKHSNQLSQATKSEQEQIDALGARVVMDESLYHDLNAWVNKHYRDRLEFSDLQDPILVNEIQSALAELEHIIQIPNLYNL